MDIYLFIVIALLLLAVFDLVVGVGNDAVNFLNSAIGSKVATRRTILFIAAAGILLGATFSSGMMEIARSGVFHPDQFTFQDIMVLFLAVMITDIILLDTFNTFGLPTSTTVSIVFELLGAGVAVAIYKIYNSPETVQDLEKYINSGRAFTIISGILLSVVISFTIGAIVMFLSRIIFTFNYRSKLKYFGAVWSSLAITSIVYFILVKGAKGASFLTPEMNEWIQANTREILGVCFLAFLVISQLLISVFRYNIFKLVVLIGTFSIAMAFAGNDLVNFIGVPLAGLDSYLLMKANPVLSPDTYTMESLLDPVRTPTLYLLFAGIIMILALFFSKKARSVTDTEVELARQSEGYERFSSSTFAQAIVRKTMQGNTLITKALPKTAWQKINTRFVPIEEIHSKGVEHAHFDLVRAGVNMFVASILIASATSLKLPLSTTYVTFMTAMGTSLADRAWGRESAVYRVTGVLTVIAGWFFTALIAFTVAFLFALFIRWGGLPIAIVTLIFAFFVVIRSNVLHKKRVAKKEKEISRMNPDITHDHALDQFKENTARALEQVRDVYGLVVSSFLGEDLKTLKKAKKDITALTEATRELRRDVYITLRKLREDELDSGQHFVKTAAYMREMAYSIQFIDEPFYKHIANAHRPVLPEQDTLMRELTGKMQGLLDDTVKALESEDIGKLESVNHRVLEMIDTLDKAKKFQIKLIKSEKAGTRNSLLVFNFFSESRNLMLQLSNLIISQIDFMHDQHRLNA